MSLRTGLWVMASAPIFVILFDIEVGIWHVGFILWEIVFTIGECMWSPRLVAWTVTLAPIGKEGAFVALSQVIPPVPFLVQSSVIVSYCTSRRYLAHFPPLFPRCFARFHRLAETVPTGPKPEPRAKKQSARGENSPLHYTPDANQRTTGRASSCSSTCRSRWSVAISRTSSFPTAASAVTRSWDFTARTSATQPSTPPTAAHRMASASRPQAAGC